MSHPSWQPNVDQQRAIDTLTGTCVVLAGPGTGKTETLVAKTAAILQHGGLPLAVSYTRAAAQEVIQRLGLLHERVTGCTCHSLAFSLFRQLAPHIFAVPPRLLDTRHHEREAILRTVRRQCQRGPLAQIAGSLSVVELGERVSRVKMHGPGSDEERAILALYEGAKGSARIDFQDLLLLTTQMVREDPVWHAHYQRRYAHVLVDEAQDLDPLQAQFLALFVNQALTVFLDPDQAIYSYAGADPATTLEHLGRVDPRTTIALRPSYRSRAPILQSALRLIAHNPNGQHDRDLTPMRSGHLFPRWFRVTSQATEAQLTASTIARLLQRETSPTEILCLFRANAYRTMLEIALADHNIPFRVLHGAQEQQPTYLEYSVLPLTAMLLRVADVHASWIEEAALRIYVGSERAARLAQRPSGMCLTEAAYDLGDRVQRAVAAFLQDEAEFRMLARQCGPGVLAEVVHKRLTRRTATPSDNPAELASAVAGCVLFPSLSSFAEHIATLERFRTLDESMRVTLATIHKAKGRQSRIVFLLGASEGVFPPRHPGTDIQEERRICFVGVTRAKDLLVVSSPRTISGLAMPVSRFITEGHCQRLFFPTPRRIAALLDRV
jgi:DNA helicase-2/ATP-dependent DNA helicase PcrA